MKTTIKLKNGNGSYKVSQTDGVETIDDYINLLIVPLLLAAGFTEKQISDYIEHG